MKLLVFSTLFPHPGARQHGIFVLERLRHWLARARELQGGGVREAVVIAPVPYVPRALARGRWAALRDVPGEERVEDPATGVSLRVLHPRYLLLPKVSMSFAPLTLARAGVRAAKRLVAQGERFDLVDAHYLYPDAVAAAIVARKLGLPLVVTARGTDVTLIPRYALPRRWLRWMLARASACIVVAEALRELVARLAPKGLPVFTLGNGVDLEKFRPLDRAEARARLGWSNDRRIVLSVGHLVERKGQQHLIAALPRLDGVELKFVGEGERRHELEAQAARIGAGSRVEFRGALPHEELYVAYSAADALALLSSREGWPNVLLEALACGTPVVATRVFGTPEVVRDPAVGTLVDSTAPEVVAGALTSLLASPPDRARVRAYAEGHSWTRTVDGVQQVFERAVAAAGSQGGRA